MDIYVIRFNDGAKEVFRWYSEFNKRLNELKSNGFKRDVDFKAYQMWF